MGRSAELDRLTGAWAGTCAGDFRSGAASGGGGSGQDAAGGGASPRSRRARAARCCRTRCYASERSLFLQPYLDALTGPLSGDRPRPAPRAGRQPGVGAGRAAVPNLEAVLGRGPTRNAAARSSSCGAPTTGSPTFSAGTGRRPAHPAPAWTTCTTPGWPRSNSCTSWFGSCRRPAADCGHGPRRGGRAGAGRAQGGHEVDLAPLPAGGGDPSRRGRRAGGAGRHDHAARPGATHCSWWRRCARSRRATVAPPIRCSRPCWLGWPAGSAGEELLRAGRCSARGWTRRPSPGDRPGAARPPRSAARWHSPPGCSWSPAGLRVRQRPGSGGLVRHHAGTDADRLSPPGGRAAGRTPEAFAPHAAAAQDWTGAARRAAGRVRRPPARFAVADAEVLRSRPCRRPNAGGDLELMGRGAAGPGAVRVTLGSRSPASCD